MSNLLNRTPGRTYYDSSIKDFVSLSHPEDIVDFLTQSDETTEESKLLLQKSAWKNQINILHKYLKDKDGFIIFEYILSRVNMRIDVVLLIGGIVYSLEFKNNEVEFKECDIDQSSGYGYALKNFYEENRDRYVVPLLIATKAPDSECSISADLGIDKLFSLFKANTKKMEEYIDLIKSKYGSEELFTEEDFKKWINSPFKPNPTIIQSARSIYMNNQVDEFFKFDAGEENLKITEKTVELIVKEARRDKKKIICFVSGVPGAGKTLVGLDLAGKTKNKNKNDLPEAVFFSGNGPLINVLTEALGREAFNKNKNKYQSKYRAVNDVKVFIQDLHAFKQDIISTKKKTISENVLIFDEAQRVWDEAQLEKWLIKKGADKSYFGLSEADLLLSTFDKKEWGVIVALVGLGQDIHTGEDGLGVWFKSLLTKHTEWNIRLSKEIFDQKADNLSAYIESIKNCSRVKEDDGLYLKTCIRTPRAKNLSEFAEALLHNEPTKAKASLEKFDDYPICITRDLKTAELFITSNVSRKERCGKLCSSNSKILGRISHNFDNIDNWHFANWMLDENGKDSSNSLNFAASEFNIQGLEIDWSLLGWDMDMYYSDGEWHQQKMLTHKRFEKSSEIQKKHILNSYRVLLTRARKGMVIYIPKTNEFPDLYGTARYYDSTYEYLKSCGIKDINDAKEKFLKTEGAVRLLY